MQKKILIINFGGIGDQILFLPTIKTLKNKYKDSSITLVTEPRSRSISELTELIDEVFICDLKKKNNFFEVIKFFKKAYSGNYDLLISSGGSPIISILLFLTGIKQRIGYDSGRFSRMLLTKAVKLNKFQYAANMYHDLVSDEKINAIPEIYPTAELNSADNSTWANDTKKTIVIHPGVSKLSVEKNIIKCWSTENWIELIRKLLYDGNYRVLLTGGPDDMDVLEIFKQHFPDNIAKTGSIKEFAAMVNTADILVCVDSAPMHIGVGLKKRVIGIFGPTDEKKLLPCGNELFTAAVNTELKCRPCLWDRRQTSCDKQNCLNISPDYIFEIIKGSGVIGVLDNLNA